MSVVRYVALALQLLPRRRRSYPVLLLRRFRRLPTLPPRAMT